jgi:hypothetical protein
MMVFDLAFYGCRIEGIAANLSGKWGRHKLKKIDTGHCVRAMKIAYRQGDVAEYDTPPDKIGRS